MATCILCLEAGSLQFKIEVFSEEGIMLNICNIIAKHFWLRPDIHMCAKQDVCLSCWCIVRDFHQLYLRVAKAHNFLEGQVLLELETDPLPSHEVHSKAEEIGNGQPNKELRKHFFHSDVKVEVKDLDLMPQSESTEDTINVSGRPERASRRGRPSLKMAKTKVNYTKRIKREPSPVAYESNESETELPLSVFLNISMKNDVKIDPTDTTEHINSVVSNKSTPKSSTPAKKRGRPRKVLPSVSSLTVAETKLYSDDPIMAVKTENTPANESDNDDNKDHEFVPAECDIGTDDDSDDSNSSEGGDSDASWLDKKEPKERFAVIPKKVVVKPKKYRKREKPLVPIKHMTREEIDARNAQQAEYDQIIASFFQNFPCPKCKLLVQNFADLKAHFRVSHNNDHGYMMCCGRRYYLRKMLAEHIYVHWNPEHFKCSICSQLLPDSRSLELHEQAHINPPEPKEKKIFNCEKCPKSFTTKDGFDYHMTTKHMSKSEFKFTCSECNQKLPTKRKLKDHMKYMHNPESAIICDKCGKQVRTQYSLKKHHEIFHSDVPRPVPEPVQCEICGTWLRHASALKTHTRTIHEEAGGEYRCPICDKASVNSRALRRHIHLNHEMERKFKCTMCEKAFKRPQDLREHTSTHTGEVLYTCPNCPMTFFCNANMHTHRKRLHRAQWEADRRKQYYPRGKKQTTAADALKIQQAVESAANFFPSNREDTTPMEGAEESEVVHNHDLSLN